MLLSPLSSLWGQGLARLQVRVIDPSGAVVPHATVNVMAKPRGPSRVAISNGQGIYKVNGLVPGQYTATATAPGFATSSKGLLLAPGQTLTLDIHLAIALEAQQVEVRGQAAHLQIAPESNATAVGVSGNNLNALSNDPDELQSQIGALAGPSVGPGGAEIYINGFTGGDMPPKSAIREIRVNANPFSAENNRLGYGRIDITTKPGSTAYHGDISSEYNDSHMNALSPFLAASNEKPPSYHSWLWDADLGGPLGRKASFFFDFQRRNINRASLVNTVVLDSNLNVVLMSLLFPTLAFLRTSALGRISSSVGTIRSA